MASFDILARLETLNAVNLTIREQVRLASNPDEFRWPALAPRVATNSLKIRDFTKRGLRLTAEYRAWNANGRELFDVTGALSEWEILPLTAKKTFDEKRLLELSLPDPTIRQLVDNGIVADVDEWTSRLADAVWRKLEAAFFQHWYTNTFTVMDPQTGTVVTEGLAIDASRYVTEGAAWTSAAYPTGTAWSRFLFHVSECTRLFGVQPGAARMRQAVYDAIVGSAPPAANNVLTTELTVADRLRERGINTRLIVDERTYDKPTDGGTGYTETYYVPQGKVAFQPADGRVGNTPSVAASRGGKEITSDRRINLRDVTIWHTSLNRGQSLLLEAENIAVPMPENDRTYVVDTLIT